MPVRLAAVLAWLVVGVARAAPVATGAPAALPEGPERALVARRCGTGCHGLEVVTSQRRPAARGNAVVGDRVTRGARGSDAEIEAVLACLVRNFGDATAAPVSPAPEAEPAPAPPRLAVVRGAALDLGRYTTGWPAYGHDAGGARHSPLGQIAPGNAARLRLAWSWDARAATAPPGARERASQMTPLVVGNAMFLTTPSASCSAAATGTARRSTPRAACCS